jgi:hypothetical protein
MKFILNVINILDYINSASNNTSSASVMLSCVIVYSVKYIHLRSVFFKFFDFFADPDFDYRKFNHLQAIASASIYTYLSAQLLRDYCTFL